MSEPTKLTLSVTEMAEALGISRPIAYELVKRKDFPAIQIGRRVVIPKSELNRWLSEQTGKAV